MKHPTVFCIESIGSILLMLIQRIAFRFFLAQFPCTPWNVEYLDFIEFSWYFGKCQVLFIGITVIWHAISRFTVSGLFSESNDFLTVSGISSKFQLFFKVLLLCVISMSFLSDSAAFFGGYYTEALDRM